MSQAGTVSAGEPRAQVNGTAEPYMLRLNKAFEQHQTDVVAEIAAQDTMLDRSQSWGEAHYFEVGQSALRCIKLAMLAVGRTNLHTVLDLPCGHGRVLRVLRAAYPHATITACDLDRDGIAFCARTFGAIPVYSAENPREIPVSGPFDLVWCGSLLTHLDQDRWPAFLSFFTSVLAPDGLLAFTVHGRRSVQWLRTGHFDYHLPDVPAILQAYDRSGFAYQDYRAHEHRNYGISLSSPAWVIAQVLKQPGLRLIHYIEWGWGNHQDVVACVRDQST